MGEVVDSGVVLLIALLSSFLTPFTVSSVGIALPMIGKEFSMDAVMLSWVSTAYLLTSAAFLLPMSRIADMQGRKRVFAWGVAGYTLASLLSAASTSAIVLICFQALLGLSGAMIFGTALAILTLAFPATERGKVLGMNAAAVYVGLSVGPFLGGLLTQHFGWRSVFLMNAPVGIAVVLLTLWKLKAEWVEAEGEKMDLVGSVIYMLSLTTVMYGVSLLPASSGGYLLLIGALGAAAFAIWETRTKNPILNVGLFTRNRAFALSNLAAVMNYVAMFAVGFLVSLYLQHVRELTPGDAGLLLLSQPVVMAVASPFAGRISDRVEPQLVASFGMVTTSLGLLLLSVLSEGTPLVYVITSLALIGLGSGLFTSPNSNAIMSSVDRRFYGVASGAIGTVRLIGQMLSMGTASAILALRMGRVQMTPENYMLFMESLRISFGVFTIVCLFGAFVSLAGRRRSVSSG